MVIIRKNIFIISVIAALVFSVFVPMPGLKLKEAGLLSYLTFLAMFISGLGISFEKIKESFKDYKSLLYSFFAIYCIFPLLIFVIFTLHGSAKDDIYIGAAILAAQSSTLSSAVILTMAASGNVPLAIIITIVNNMVSPFITPFILKLLLASNAQVMFNLKEMVLKLIFVLIVPIVSAQILRLFIKKYLDSISSWRKLLGHIIVIVFVLCGASSASSVLLSNFAVVINIIILVSFVHLLMLGFSFLFSRIFSISKESRVPVMFCSSQKTLPASLLVWGNFFSEYLLAPVVIVLYHVIQLFIDSILVNIFNSNKEETAT